MGFSGGGSVSNFPATLAPLPSGDVTGATDTAAVQTLINNAFAAGGGVIQLRYAPTTNPYYFTQLKIRAHVTIQGLSRMSTTWRAPAGQPAGLHMCILYDSGNDYDTAIQSLTMDGNNGNPVDLTWGNQANGFSAIFWYGNPANQGPNYGLGSLYEPFRIDAFGRIEDVLITQVPGNAASGTAGCGIAITGKYVTEMRQTVTYWTGAQGFFVGAADCLLEMCQSGLSGVNAANNNDAFVLFITSQATNCKAFWPGTTFTGAVPTGAPAGNGYTLQGAGSTLFGCYAQDCGTGFYVGNGGKNAYIRGHASLCGVAVSVNDDYWDIDVHVDSAGGSPETVRYLFADTFGKVVAASKLRMTFDPSMAIGTGYYYGGANNGVDMVGCDIKIQSAKSQSVAYAAAITPDPFIAPVIRVGTLTGNLTINAPANTVNASPYPDQELEFWLPQDATGLRVVTFNAAFVTTAAIPTIASQTTVIKFRWNAGTAVWREVARSTA